MTLNNIQCGKALTSEQFVELFNNISDDYWADLQLAGDITIADRDDHIQSSLWDMKPSTLAILEFDAQYWLFEYERAYSWQELTLMTRIAATSPAFRSTERTSDDKNKIINCL
jgi:hypothetical protein